MRHHPLTFLRATAPSPGRAPLMALMLLAVAVPALAQIDGVVVGEKSRDWLVGTAVLAAPAAFRDGAEVRAWTGAGRLVTLREGTNDLICLADRPGDDRFGAACYHASLEPFMERGRQLRAEGLEGMDRQRARWEAIEAGEVPMPAAAMVYNLGFETEEIDPATADPATGRRLHVIYMAGATAESTGLPTEAGDGPWLMFPGSPSAHVMIGIPARPESGG